MPIDQQVLKALLGKAEGSSGKNRGNRWNNSGQRQRRQSEGDVSWVAGERRIDVLEKLLLMCVFCPADLNPIQMLDGTKYNKLAELAPRLTNRSSRTKVLEQLAPKMKAAFKDGAREDTRLNAAMMSQLDTMRAFQESLSNVFSASDAGKLKYQGAKAVPSLQPESMLAMDDSYDAKQDESAKVNALIAYEEQIEDLIPDSK